MIPAAGRRLFDSELRFKVGAKSDVPKGTSSVPVTAPPALSMTVVASEVQRSGKLFYRRKFKEAGFSPRRFAVAGDLAQAPYTEKEERPPSAEAERPDIVRRSAWRACVEQGGR